MARGHLRIYLGAAPGVGKTYAMLSEGQRRHERGTDVAVVLVEDHGRPKTAAMVRGLDVLPRRTLHYRGATFQEMDVDAALARHPEQALVDELAHTNVPGSRNEKRWQDVDELLDAGIDVITTLNIQHLASLNDVVELITGVKQRETIPDDVVRRADQIELVDMTPEALRRRMAHGNIYAPNTVDAALANYFRVGNLSALRELALLWLADRVDEGLQRYRAAHGIDATWEARERVVVALTGGPEGSSLIRRAARIAARGGADLLALHVVRADGLTGASPQALAEQRSLVEALGGSYHQVLGDDVPGALLDFARAENATQLVLGASRRSRTAARFTGPGIGARTIRESGHIDVHVVTHDEVGRGRTDLRLRGTLTRRRTIGGALLAATLLPLLTLALAGLRAELNLPSELLLYLLAVVAVALAGGLWPALAAAVAGSLLMNYYFTPPLYTFTIADRNNVLALAVFVAVAVMVSAVVDYAARRTRQAARASAEASTLAALSGSVLKGAGTVAELLEQARETFGLQAVGLRERGETGRWQTIAAVPEEPAAGSGSHQGGNQWDGELPMDDAHQLAIRGRAPLASDQRVLAAFTNQIRIALTQQSLAAQARDAQVIAEADRTRAALLAAVSHDLRSPLASAGAAISSLASSDVEWTAQDRAELLASAQRSLARLNRMVENLLDVSRLQAGALSTHIQPVDLQDAVAASLDELRASPAQVQVDVPDDVPLVLADQPLLERILVNLLSNGLRYSPPGTPPMICASTISTRVEVRVVDRGPGIPPQDHERVFTPFQRLGDTDTSTGVGLGLALARGLAEAMGGSLVPEETPGGGLTMTLTLAVADGHPPSVPMAEHQ